MSKIRIFCYFSLLLIYHITTLANDQLSDPLDSPSWNLMHRTMLNNEAFVFDNRVKVGMPGFAEDPANVPVSIRVESLGDISEIVVFADLNPIHKVLHFKPVHIKPNLSFRIKVEQSTPVRAAVKTLDGVWHVGGDWLEAAGGGCTAPSTGREATNWHETLMSVSSRVWIKEDKSRRLRFRIMHPMDTGLADGIPEFFLEYFDIVDSAGVLLAKIETYQPISENPVFTLDVHKDVMLPIKIVGADNNGNRLDMSLVK